MNSQLIKIVGSIGIISIIIYYIKNNIEINSFFRGKINKLKNIKYYKLLKNICILIIFVFYILLVSKEIDAVKDNFESRKTVLANNEIFKVYDEKIIEENKYFKSIMSENYISQNYSNPYILDGFSYVEGDWNTGFVIQDENENQYVWVPCTNKNIDDVIKLQKKDFVIAPNICKDNCYDESYEKSLLSILQNGGFYISRFEIGNSDGNIVSKSNQEIWNNITKNQAVDIIKNMSYGKNYNIELINGYCYDTAIEWLTMTNKINSNIIDIDDYGINLNLKTGRKSYNNIYDLFDNVMEFTNENCFETFVIRGVCKEDIKKEPSRYTVLASDTIFAPNTILSFRTILYK